MNCSTNGLPKLQDILKLSIRKPRRRCLFSSYSGAVIQSGWAEHFFAKFDPDGYRLDQLEPAFGRKHSFERALDPRAVSVVA
jgi:hypothetical protein